MHSDIELNFVRKGELGICWSFKILKELMYSLTSNLLILTYLQIPENPVSDECPTLPTVVGCYSSLPKHHLWAVIATWIRASWNMCYHPWPSPASIAKETEGKCLLTNLPSHGTLTMGWLPTSETAHTVRPGLPNPHGCFLFLIHSFIPCFIPKHSLIKDNHSNPQI